MLRLKTLPIEQSTSLEKSPEHILWTAVIAQAVRDATYEGIRKGYVECKHKAIAWLSKNFISNNSPRPQSKKYPCYRNYPSTRF